MPIFEKVGFPLHYEIIENALPYDTLFIHGNLASNAWWKPLLEVYAKKGSYQGRAILAEWRGCGSNASTPLDKEQTPSTLSQDYTDLLKHLNLKQVRVIGHSTGGLIALCALRSQPELFSKAILLDSVGATGVQFGPEMYGAFTQMSEQKEFCATIILGTIHGGLADGLLKEQIVTDAFQVHPSIWHGVPNMLNKVDIRSELKDIPQPVLVLHGEHDTLLPIEQSELLATALPQGRFQKVLHHGHCLNVEDPSLLKGLMDSFFYT